MSAVPRPFELGDPLPSGLFALDASAGTGKTFTLTSLATRWLVEGARDPAELLVVTFTRAAAMQLRARIREDLRAASATLEALAAGQAVPDVHAWIVRLGDVDAVTLEQRRRAAAQALVLLDRATVTTLHAFCRSALQSLGLLGDIGGREPARSPRRVRDDVVRDALLRELGPDAVALFDPEDESSGEPAKLEGRLTRAVVAALDDPGARLLPEPDPGPDGTHDARARIVPDVALRWRGLVREVVADLRGRLERRGELDFGQLIARADELLADPERGPAAAADLRRQYRFVLVDEMQDTDAAQWRILQRAFLGEEQRYADASDMVIVGDPKQSVYRFRGADVNAYLRARALADDEASLTVNFRSSPALLAGLDLLLRGATFGSRGIPYVPVSPRPGAEPALTGVDGALEIRWVPRYDTLRGERRGKDGTTVLTAPTAGKLDAHVLRDLAQRALELLRTTRIRTGDDAVERPLQPGDIAVLVASGADADAVLEAMDGAGLPAVRPRSGSVLASEAVEQWRLLLGALDAPGDRRRVSALLLSWFVAAPLEAIGDAELVEHLQERCAAWRSRLERDGVLPFLLSLTDEEEVAAALARAGERGRTDLEHVGELLHAELGARPTPTAGVRRAFESLVRAVGPDDVDVEDPAVRRLETDGSAVQVMTFHAAKGLEFPVVLLPIVTKRTKPDRLLPWRYATPDGPVVDVAAWSRWRRTGGDPGPDDLPDDRERRAAEEEARDRDRILYVALTRARERLVVWWSPRPGAEEALLARLLFGPRDEDGALLATDEAVAAPDDDETQRELDAWAERSGGAIVAVRVPEVLPTDAMVDGVDPVSEPLATAVLHREPSEPSVARWSFTRLNRRIGPAGHGDAGAPDDATRQTDAVDVEGTSGEDGRTGDGDDVPVADLPGGDEEIDREEAASGGSGTGGVTEGPEPDAPLETGGPLAQLAGGTAVGVVLHEILEDVPFDAADLAAAVTARVLETEPRRLAVLQPELEREDLVARVADGLTRALTTPLDALHPGLRLADLGGRDRLAEPAFDLPIADTAAPIRVRDLGAAVADGLPAGEIRELFARLAASPGHVRLAGWLTGVADLVVRAPDGRYAVLDHKSNRLETATTSAATGRLVRRPAYDQRTMERTACSGRYVLQGLLYLVALHRWLDRRLPGYTPDTQLGGFGLLFLRGMTGPDTPVDEHGHRDGVWWWAPPAAVVLAADRALRGGEVSE